MWKFICDRQWNDAYDMKSRALYMYLLRCMYVVSACCPCQLSLSTVRAAAGCWLLLLAGHCALGRSIQYSCQPDYYHVAFARVDEKVEKGR